MLHPERAPILRHDVESGHRRSTRRPSSILINGMSRRRRTTGFQLAPGIAVTVQLFVQYAVEAAALIVIDSAVVAVCPFWTLMFVLPGAILITVNSAGLVRRQVILRAVVDSPRCALKDVAASGT